MSDDITLAVFDGEIEVKEVILNKIKKIKKYSFRYGLASVKIRNELKPYFAIQIKKSLIKKIDEQILFDLMGDNPFVMNFNDDSIIYLRTKLNSLFIEKKKTHKSLLNLLNNK